MAVDAPTTAPPLAAAQHKAALWADDSVHVYAVLMGSRIPDLPQRLAEAELADYDCLLPGALAPELQRSAPYLAKLKRESPFTDWLLFEAIASLTEWGVLVRSPVRLMSLRNHLRGLLEAQTPGGHRIRLDWMDPELLQALLPLFGPSELHAFFGPAQSLVVTGTQAWRHASLELGRLTQVNVPLAQGA